MLIDKMGSICSSANNNNNNAALPPKDLGELLQQAEKVRLLDHKSLCSAMCRQFLNWKPKAGALAKRSIDDLG